MPPSCPNNPALTREGPGGDRTTCPDCYQCQSCSLSRCRACREGGNRGQVSHFETGFTYGQYLEWKAEREREPNSGH